MIGPAGISPDGGRTWSSFKPTPDFNADLPFGYRPRRSPLCSIPEAAVLLTCTTPWTRRGWTHPFPSHRWRRNRITCGIVFRPMPVVRGRSMRLRTFKLGNTEQNPMAGVWKGKNGAYFGDIGSLPIFTRRNELLVPIQICPLGSDGKLSNPGGGYTYHDAAILIGKWQGDGRLKWDISQRIVGDPARSTRGMISQRFARWTTDESS